MAQHRPDRVCMGGTFDPFHRGHEALLDEAFEVAEEIVVGLTTDEYVKARKDREVAPFEERAKRLREYAEGKDGRLVIVPLYEEFGPAPFQPDMDGIVVSEETKAAADRINELRERWGRTPLTVHVVPLVEADDGEPISGTRVAAGEIDAEGQAA